MCYNACMSWDSILQSVLIGVCVLLNVVGSIRSGKTSSLMKSVCPLAKPVEELQTRVETLEKEVFGDDN